MKISECPLLFEIDLRPFVNVKEIGPGFLFECTGLKRIYMTTKMRNAGFFNDYFFIEHGHKIILSDETP